MWHRDDRALTTSHVIHHTFPPMVAALSHGDSLERTRARMSNAPMSRRSEWCGVSPSESHQLIDGDQLNCLLTTRVAVGLAQLATL